MREVNIATLTACFVNANKDNKTPPVKPSDFYYFDNKKENNYPYEISQIYHSLRINESLPSWFLGLLDLDKIEPYDADYVVSYPRVLITKGLIILNPTLEESHIVGGAVFVDDFSETIAELIDFDTEEKYKLEIPQLTENPSFDVKLNKVY